MAIAGAGVVIFTEATVTKENSPSPKNGKPFIQAAFSLIRIDQENPGNHHLMSPVQPAPAHVPPQDAGRDMGYNKGMTGTSVKRYLKFT